MKRYAIIVAGGSGIRMGSAVPKQFLILKGMPVLMHTLLKFQKICDEVILVLPKDQLEFWGKLCADHDFRIPHKMALGGKTRFQSVYNGLKLVPEDALVAIHDGVRPLVSETLIEHCFQTAYNDDAAVAAVKLKDTIRDEKGTLKRERFRLVQTPQTYKSGLLKDAYDFAMVLDPEGIDFTDDASVYEKSGKTVVLVEGDYKNIKITTPEDLLIAEAFLKS